MENTFSKTFFREPVINNYHPGKTKDTIFHGCQVKKNPHFAPIVILPSYIGSG